MGITKRIHLIMKLGREKELREMGFYGRNFLRRQGERDPFKIALMDNEAGICLTNRDLPDREKVQMLCKYLKSIGKWAHLPKAERLAFINHIRRVINVYEVGTGFAQFYS